MHTATATARRELKLPIIMISCNLPPLYQVNFFIQNHFHIANIPKCNIIIQAIWNCHAVYPLAMSLNKELATVIWIYEESLFSKLFYLTQCTAYAVITVCMVVKFGNLLGKSYFKFN